MGTIPAYVLELTKSLLEFQKTGYLCDTVIVVDDGQLKAHSAILAAASPVFKGALRVDSTPLEHTVIMPGVQLSVAETIVQYMYTGNFVVADQSVDSNMLNKLQQAVHEFGMNLQLVTEDRNALVEDAKTGDKCEKETCASAECGQVKSTEDSVDDPECDEETEALDIGSAFRRNHRRKRFSSKVHINEPNVHSDLKSLYGTRTDLDRRCPKDPCPCGTEMQENVAEAGVDGEAVPVEHPVTQAHKGSCMCEMCGKVLPDWQRLEQHKNTHPGDEPIHCTVCGRGFALAVHLDRHMKTHTADRPFICSHCGIRFAEKGFLDMHMIAHLPEGEKEVSMTSATAETATFRCRTCGETFTKKWRLQKHRTEMHRTRPPLKTRPNSRCTCPICGKSLSYRLSVHMRLHTGERPYKCSTCGKEFYQRSSLRTHLSMHTGVKNHTCTECGKSFRLQGLLRQHMRKHNGDLRHECPLCHKRFWVPTLLRDHLLLHTGERPFQCATCGRNYRLHKELVKHERLHTGEAPTRCEICGLETTSVKRHMLIHTGDKPYSCDDCGKSFRRKEHLRVHCSRVHGIELPKREKVQTLSLENCMLALPREDVEGVNADDCSLTLVVGDSVIVQ